MSALRTYRSPSQFKDGLGIFSDNSRMTMQILAQKIFFLMTNIRDLNAKSKNW